MGAIMAIKNYGDFRKTKKFLKKSFGNDYQKILEKYGQQGVESLSANTPIESGQTASSWYYKVSNNRSQGNISVTWYNSNVNSGINIAVILQYGHATRHGGYVQGRDYINPSLRPIFDKIAETAWKEVTSL